MQNKSYDKNKTKDDTYNITDTNKKKVTNEQINADTNVTLQANSKLKYLKVSNIKGWTLLTRFP